MKDNKIKATWNLEDEWDSAVLFFRDCRPIDTSKKKHLDGGGIVRCGDINKFCKATKNQNWIKFGVPL